MHYTQWATIFNNAVYHWPIYKECLEIGVYAFKLAAL